MSVERADIARALQEFGAAIRGDWGTIDGRSVRIGMDSFANYVVQDEPYSLAEIRNALDLCPDGQGHWTYFCSEHK